MHPSRTLVVDEGRTYTAGTSGVPWLERTNLQNCCEIKYIHSGQWVSAMWVRATSKDILPLLFLVLFCLSTGRRTATIADWLHISFCFLTSPFSLSFGGPVSASALRRVSEPRPTTLAKSPWCRGLPPNAPLPCPIPFCTLPLPWQTSPETHAPPRCCDTCGEQQFKSNEGCQMSKCRMPNVKCQTSNVDSSPFGNCFAELAAPMAVNIAS